MYRALLALTLLLSAPSAALASGCYICAGGSAPACKDYCQYDGADTFDNRHRCASKGCKIGGTASCPGPSGAVKICQSKLPEPVAAAAWCAPPA